MSIAAQRSASSGVRAVAPRILAQLALASLLLLALGILVVTVVEQPASKAAWTFAVVPQVLILTVLSIGLAFAAGLPLRTSARGRAWIREHGWLIWMCGGAGILFVVGALALVGIDPLLFAAGRPGYAGSMALVGTAWCVTAFCAVHLPLWFSATDRGRRRANALTRELGVLALQAVIACAVVWATVSGVFVFDSRSPGGVQAVLSAVAAGTFSVVFFVSVGFLLGLPFRLIGRVRHLWSQVPAMSALAILVCLGGVIVSSFDRGSPALDLWLLGLAFFLVNARLPVRRWRESPARRLPSAR